MTRTACRERCVTRFMEVVRAMQVDPGLARRIEADPVVALARRVLLQASDVYKWAVVQAIDRGDPDTPAGGGAPVGGGD